MAQTLVMTQMATSGFVHVEHYLNVSLQSLQLLMLCLIFVGIFLHFQLGADLGAALLITIQALALALMPTRQGQFVLTNQPLFAYGMLQVILLL